MENKYYNLRLTREEIEKLYAIFEEERNGQLKRNEDSTVMKSLDKVFQETFLYGE